MCVFFFFFFLLLLFSEKLRLEFHVNQSNISHKMSNIIFVENMKNKLKVSSAVLSALRLQTAIDFLHTYIYTIFATFLQPIPFCKFKWSIIGTCLTE